MEQADAILIPSSSMLKKETIEAIRQSDKKIILRIDNIPKNSRNRNTGTSRLKQCAEMADMIVYQSQWAKEYVGGWLGKDGRVIYNGIDTAIFNKSNQRQDNVYVYSRINRDETKGWHEAWYEYQMIHRENRKNELWIIGNFSEEQIGYNFDFFNNEMYSYYGAIEDKQEYADILKQAGNFIMSYYNDACSNALIEALNCGLKIRLTSSGNTGGTPEILKLNAEGYDWSLERMAKEYLNVL